MRFFIITFLCSLTLNTSVLAQDFAIKQLSSSPRHHEWIQIPSDHGKTLNSFVAYPEKKDNALAIIVIHENRGLTDWVRSFADQLAAEGFLVIAPDLLSGFDDEHTKTSDFENSDEARNAIYQLNQDQITHDLKAIQKYVTELPSSNGKIAVMGFCWGGSQTFRYAANSKELSAVFVFYGSSPEAALLQRISTPVYGFYGENDQRINATIPNTELLMKNNKKAYESTIYPGAGHAFMRHGDDPDGSEENRDARNNAWNRLKQILATI